MANKYRSGVAELTQGVAHGNDGVAQLQIMDTTGTTFRRCTTG
jgi:hypothetical protein